MQDTQKGTKLINKNPRGTGAFSAGLAIEERARSLLVYTTDEVEDSVPRERSHGQYPEYEGQADADSVPTTLDYPANPSVDLAFLDDHSWCFSE